MMKPTSLQKKRETLIANGVIKSDLRENIRSQIEQPHGFAFNLCGHCTFNCSYCPQSFEKMPQEFVDLNIVARLLDDTKNTPSYFQFGTRGENMLHPNFSEILVNIKSANPKHYITVNNNGLMMNECEFIEKVLRTGLDQLIFSLQSINPDVYRKLVGYRHHDRILSNIHKTIEVRDNLKLPVMIGVQYLDSPENRPYLQEFLDYWEPFNVYTYNQTLHGWGNKFGLPERPDKERFPCLYLWLYPNISHKGNVCSCFADFFDENKFGNLQSSSLSDIWQSSPLRRQMIRDHLSGQWDKMPMCKDCNGWTEFENVFERDGKAFLDPAGVQVI